MIMANELSFHYALDLINFDRNSGHEIHRPILDADKYDYTYAPDPQWCRIVEFYCPACGTMVENEYLPPGHPLTNDIELDIDKLKETHLSGERRSDAAG